MLDDVPGGCDTICCNVTGTLYYSNNDKLAEKVVFIELGAKPDTVYCTVLYSNTGTVWFKIL
jgi:hypothetical protein